MNALRADIDARGYRQRRWPSSDSGRMHIRALGRQRIAMTSFEDASIEPARLAAWLGDVADGDRGAFEQLYRAASAKVFGICARLLRDRGEAEDALQDVFTTIWHKAGQFDATRAGAMTWMAMIARNKCIDRLRSHAHLRRNDAIELAEQVADSGPDGLETAERADDRARLEACLGELDGNRQKLLRTAFFEGVTYEELAARSDTPLGTVKSWIRRSLLKLKACLER